MPEKKERLFNTRKRTQRKKPETRKVVFPVPFSAYVHEPDVDGFVYRHYAPCTYFCKTLRIFLDNTSGGKVQLRINDNEYVEKEVVQGDNVFQVERIIPAGTRIRLRLIDGTTATGIWVAWVGEIDE